MERRSKPRSGNRRRTGPGERRSRGDGSDFASLFLMRCGVFWTAPLMLLVICISQGVVGPGGEQDGASQDVLSLVVLPALLLLAVSAGCLAVDCIVRSDGMLMIVQVIVQALLLVGFVAAGLSSPSPAAAPADAVASEGAQQAVAPRPPEVPAVVPDVSLEAASGKALRGGGQERKLTRDELLARPTRAGKMSVVLPCLNESTTATKTVMSFCDRTPSELLAEIIVVDDGSTPPLAEVLYKEVPDRCKLRIQRHDAPVGLMGAKQTGGDNALGEFVGFYDCHVAPRRGWHEETIELLKEKERRLVIPMIGTLDVTKWDEVPGAGTVGKCYMNWNADWWWYDDDSVYTPVISGGLVATTRNWWRDSGGFDSGMHGWGGENTETAIRVWLCGGDVIRAKKTLVAHMWRTDADKRTVARYKITTKTDNVARVAAGWFDEFSHKFRNQGPDPSIDVGPVKALQKKLGCKPFVHFLHRFRQIYMGGGMLPDKVFHIRSMVSGKCIQRHAKSYLLVPCGEASWFHYGNQAPAEFPVAAGLDEALSDTVEDPEHEVTCGGHKAKGGCSKCPQGHGSEWCHADCTWVMGQCISKEAAHKLTFIPEKTCCSGLREWNSLDCMETLFPKGPGVALCDVVGHSTMQQYSWESGGHIRHHNGLCISQDPNDNGPYPHTVGVDCKDAHRFEMADAFEPEETKIYRDSVLRHGLTDDIPDH